MPPQPSVTTTELARRLEKVMARLGYVDGPALIRSWVGYKSETGRHVVRQAFETIKVHSVVGFTSRQSAQPNKFAPILYFAVAGSDPEADAIHRRVWSQGVIPILLVATPSGLQIRKGLGPPTLRPVTVAWGRLAADQELPVELTSLTAVALTTSVVWNDFAIDRSNRVDSALLDAIASLNEDVRKRFSALRNEHRLVNSVIGRFIYLFVLLDRGVISASWVRKLNDKNGKPLCAVIAQSLLDDGGIDPSDKTWPAREVWALFDRIDDILNGAIFPITTIKRRQVPSEAMHLVRRAIRHGDVLREGTRQLGFLDVSFATLRTETISAIYELFLLIESRDDKDEVGAFYTPPFLVDYVLDEVDRIRPFNASSRVLDPAAGSGIFLVGAYRRILERTMPRGRWKAAHVEKAKGLLEASIFGIERNGQAANVARFSLYLTLLDYVENTSIEALQALVRHGRLFPALENNVLDRDLFTVSDTGPGGIGRFTHVVGNPPWGTFGERSDRTNVGRSASESAQRRARLEATLAFYSELNPDEWPVTNKRLSELFVWKIHRDLITRNSVMGLLISARSFVARTANAFPNALAGKMKIVGLANLSHFRYRLFKGARSPTLAIFAEQKQSEHLDRLWVYSPLLTSQPIGQNGHLWSIIVSDLDVGQYRLRDLTRSTDGWFSSLMLRPIDRRFANYLKLWSSKHNATFGAFLERSNLRIARGGSPSQTRLPSSLLLGAENYRERLGLSGLGFNSYPHAQLRNSVPAAPFRKMFDGNIVLIPRHMNEVIYVEEPIAFGSSFNALYFSEYPLSKQRGVAALKGIARFLTSDIARYMYALFGKTWLLDHARLEKRDLEGIPFPLDKIGSAEIEHLEYMDESQLTQLFAQKTGLGRTFVATIEEYATFRHGYEDAQIPDAGLSPPDTESVSRYVTVLIEQLCEQFGSEARIDHRISEPDGNERFGYVDIRIKKSGAGPSSSDDHEDTLLRLTGPESGFSPHSNIAFLPQQSRVGVSKPWAQVAWTVEQAFADAHGIAEEVLRSGGRA